MPEGPMQADMNWFGVLAHHAHRAPDRPLVVFDGVTVTYGEMAARAAALAAGLRARGVGRGAVVGLLSYNCPEFLETIFAVNHLGGVAMPINWRLAAPEVRYILEHSEGRALVCDDALVPVANDATKGMEDALARVCIADAPPSGWASLADLRREANLAPHACQGDDVHRLMYTSGTTGRPKGVMI